MKRLIPLIIFALIPLQSCAEDRLIPLDQTFLFQVYELESADTVKVSGIISSSPLVIISRIVTERIGDTLVLRVFSTSGLAKSGGTAFFLEQVNVPPEVSKVSFGTMEDVVWQRAARDSSCDERVPFPLPNLKTVVDRYDDGSISVRLESPWAVFPGIADEVRVVQRGDVLVVTWCPASITMPTSRIHRVIVYSDIRALAIGRSENVVWHR